MHLFRFVKLLLVAGFLFLTASFVLSCNSSSSSGRGTTTSDLGGTWKAFSSEGTGPEKEAGNVVMIQSGSSITFSQECGNVYMGTFTLTGKAITASFVDSDGTTVFTGSVNDANTEISGTITNAAAPGIIGTMRLTKLSESISTTSSGSMTLTGAVCGKQINISTTDVCASKDMDGTTLDDIEVQTTFENGYIGLSFDNPDALMPGTFDLGSGMIYVDFEALFLDDCVGDEYITATGGTLVVTSYDDNNLVATFTLELSTYGSVSGSINVNAMKVY